MRPDQVAIGVLVDAVPRDAVDEAVAACGIRERHSDGKLPAHMTAYLTLGLYLFPDDYEEVATRVTGSLDRFGCWDAAWTVPTASAVTQARKRLGREVFPELFDGFEVDVPDTRQRRGVRVRRVREEPVRIPQGPRRRVGRVRHARVRGRGGRRLLDRGEDLGAAALRAAASRRAAHRRPRVLLLRGVGRRRGARPGSWCTGRARRSPFSPTCRTTPGGRPAARRRRCVAPGSWSSGRR